MPRPDPARINTMAELRVAIDEIDDALMVLFAERPAFVDRAPVLKQREGIAAAAPSRRAAVLKRVREKATEAGFEPDIAEPMWRIMIDAVIAREEKVMGTEGRDA